MTGDPERVSAELRALGESMAERAFARACGEVERVAKAPKMVPFGWYGASRKRGGKAGGALKASLRVEILGVRGGQILARCVSDLPYAGAQHDKEFHHPGLYTRGHAGPEYRAAYFERAVRMVFGGETDPLGFYAGKPKTFADLLAAESRRA
jgi:hypothetical protein